MKCDITVNDKDFSCTLDFELENLSKENDYKQAMAILTIVAGDYNLDPQLGLDEFTDIIKNGQDKDKLTLRFYIDEEEVEAEFL